VTGSQRQTKSLRPLSRVSGPDDARALVETYHGIEIDGRRVRLRCLVSMPLDQTARTHVLIAGYTLSAEVFAPIAAELIARGHNAIVLDPFTMFDFPPAAAARLAVERPDYFTPSGYAERVYDAMTGFQVAPSVFWGESMGAHIALYCAAMKPKTVTAIVLINPVGLRHNVGGVIGPMVPVALKALRNPGLLRLVAAAPSSSRVRRLVWRLARAASGNPHYAAVGLEDSATVIASSAEASFSAMVLPPLGMNRDVLDDAALSFLEGVHVSLILSRDDRVLPNHIDDQGHPDGDYRDAWIRTLETAEPRVHWISGGHEAVFHEGFDAE